MPRSTPTATRNYDVEEKVLMQTKLAQQTGETTIRCLLFACAATRPHFVPVLAVRRTEGIITDYDLAVDAYVSAQSTNLTPVANLDRGRQLFQARESSHTWVMVGPGTRGTERMNLLVGDLAHNIHYGDVLFIKIRSNDHGAEDLHEHDIDEILDILHVA